MSYKTSQFNIKIPVEQSEEMILFNTKECSFVVLDKENQGFLNDIREIDKYDEEVVSNLIELGFIVDSDLDEIKNIREATLSSRVSNEELAVTIGTTLDCNMNCYYCFEEKNKTYLSTEDADKIIKFIIDKLSSGRFEKLVIFWTGGEPLLNKDMIKYISIPLIKFCRERGLQYIAAVITNGLLLTEDNAKFLKSMNVGEIQVTIDGLEDTHNKRRLALDKVNSFQTIIDNINTACKYISIIIRVNIDRQNYKEIRELIKYLYANLGYDQNEKISISLGSVSGCSTSFEQEEYLDFYRDIYDEYMPSSKLEVAYPKPLKFACGADCNSSYVIGPDGFLYKCWEQIGIKEYSIGTIDREQESCELCQKYLKDAWPEKCNFCTCLPLCHGGCPRKRFDNNNQPICAQQTRSIDKYLKKYYELWKAENAEVES